MSSQVSDTLYDPKPAWRGDPPQVVAPALGLFGLRAERFDELAERDEAMGPYLRFNAHVARAQQQVLEARELPSTMTPASWQVAIENDFPPLTPLALLDSSQWQLDLQALLSTLDVSLAKVGEFAAQQAVIKRFDTLHERDWHQLAEQVVTLQSVTEEWRGIAPLVGAALQISWVRFAQSLAVLPARPAEKGLCPCCGMPPVGSVVQLGRHRERIRYLVCSLCASEWFLERIRCSYCLTNARLDYIGMSDDEGTRVGALRAECCEECKASVKLSDREWEEKADPFADDLATLGLDARIEALGYYRAGVNLLLALG